MIAGTLRGRPVRREPRRILVYKLDHLGDLLISTPALTALREKYPRAEIRVVIGEWNLPVLENNPHIDGVVVYNSSRFARPEYAVHSFAEVRRQLAGWTPDLVVGLRADWSSIWHALLNARHIVESGREHILDKFTRGKTQSSLRHELEAAFRVLAPLDIYPASIAGLEIHFTPAEREEAAHFIKQHAIREPFAVIQAAATVPLREWALDRFELVARSLHEKHGMQIVLIGSPNEVGRSKELAALIADFSPVNIAGMRSIRQSAAVLERAAIYVGSDGGAMHLAAASGAPTVGIFGPGSIHNFRPLAKHAVAVSERFPCSPCKQITCIRPEDTCMNALQAGPVISAVNTIIAESIEEAHIDKPINITLPWTVIPKPVKKQHRGEHSVADSSRPIYLFSTAVGLLRSFPRRKNYRRILIYKLDHLGDLLISTPALAAIRKRFPQAEIKIVIGEWNRQLLDHNPNVDGIVLYNSPRYTRKPYVPDSFASVRRQLGDWKPDLIIGLRDDWTTLLRSVFSVARRIESGRAHLLERLGLTAQKRGSRHELERIWETLAPLGIRSSGSEKFELFIVDGEREGVFALMEELGIEQPFAVLHPGSSQALREWSLRKFAEVAMHLTQTYGMQIVIAGAPNESARANDLAQMIAPLQPVVVAGRLGLRAMGAFMEQAALYVGSDGGAMHLASAVGTPTVGLYGPSHYDVFHPIGEHTAGISAGFQCSPCDQIHCIRPHDTCMMAINAQTVIAHIDRLLASREMVHITLPEIATV